MSLSCPVKVSRVKNRVKKEGVSDSEELVDRIAEECGVSRRKAGYVSQPPASLFHHHLKPALAA